MGRTTEDAARDMSPALSVYLDLLRVVAASWVALSHFNSWGLAPAALAALLPREGHDAVIIFFVLSGFVIAHSQARKRSGLRGYAVDRASRLYSVVLPILIGSFVVDALGAWHDPQAYAGHYVLAKPWLYIPFHLAFLGETWTLREVPPSIPQYWSLAYEAWYYVLFAILLFYRGKRRVVLLLLVVVILGPQHLVLWPVWLAGVALFAVIERWRLPPGVAALIFAASILGYALLEVLHVDTALWHLSARIFVSLVGHEPGNARQYLGDYLVAVLVVANILAFRHSGWVIPARLARSVHWAAGYSFTLYMLHGPLLLTLRNFVELRGLGLATSLGILVFLVAMTILVGTVTEKRRELYRRGFARLVAAIARRTDRYFHAFPFSKYGCTAFLNAARSQRSVASVPRKTA